MGTPELRPAKTKTVPVVLSKEEVKAVLANLSGVYQLVVQVMYGGGLRAMEALRLRVKDIDFANPQVIVRDGKGDHDRYTTLPDSTVPALRLHLRQVNLLHE